MKSVDINCDMGESYGNYTIGNDLALEHEIPEDYGYNNER